MAAISASALAIASTVAAVGSAGAQIYGQRQQAKAQEKAAEYNNKLAENEAKNLELENHEAISRQRRNNKRELSTIRARLAANGTLTTEGTPLAILGEIENNQEIAIADAARSTAIKASSIRSQGQMGLWEAKVNTQASRTRMIGTALSTVSKLSTKIPQSPRPAKK